MDKDKLLRMLQEVEDNRKFLEEEYARIASQRREEAKRIEKILSALERFLTDNGYM